MFGYALLLILPALVLTESPLETLEQKIFKEIDSDKDGKLIKLEHDAYYGAFDVDKNGEISFQEFKTVIDNSEPALVGHEEALYKLLDRDNNGKVDRADIDSIFVFADKNKDGAIDKSEYHVVFENIQKVLGQGPTGD